MPFSVANSAGFIGEVTFLVYQVLFPFIIKQSYPSIPIYIRDPRVSEIMGVVCDKIISCQLYRNFSVILTAKYMPVVKILYKARPLVDDSRWYVQ